MLDIATEKSKDNKIYLINLKGRIDSITAGDFRDYYEDMIRAGHRKFIFNATDLEFVSSAGIAAFVRFIRHIDSIGGAGALVNLNNEIRLTMEFFGLENELPIFDTVKEASRYLQTQGTEPADSLSIGEKEISFKKRREKDSFKENYLRDSGSHVVPAHTGKDTKTYSELSPDLSVVSAETDEAKEKESLSSSRMIDASNIIARSASEEKQPEIQVGETGIAHEAFRVIRCEQCGVNLRVYHLGEHLCPECGIEFRVKGDGTVSYFEKL